VNGRVGLLQRPIAGDENWFKRRSGREYPDPKGWMVAGEHPRPPLDCQLSSDGWLIAGGGDPNGYLPQIPAGAPARRRKSAIRLSFRRIATSMALNR
jgi:hypothetical protein